MLKLALLLIKLGTQQERKEQKGKKDTMVVVVDSVVLGRHGKRVPSRYWLDQDACLMVST